MAQTGYTPILIYSSSTASAAPIAGNLTNSTLGSELAINITDGKLFYKDNANAIQVIGWKVVPTTAGGTGLTSFTANQVFYASSTSVIAQSANLTFNGTTLTSGGFTTTGAISTATLSASGVATFSAGTVSAPAITTAGDTNTGIFFPAADTIAFTEGGVESVRIDNNGNVGIGTSTTSNSKLTVVASTGGTGGIRVETQFGSAYFGNFNNYPAMMYDGASLKPIIVYDTNNNANILYSNNTERLRIFSSGGVSIGNTTDPGATNLFVSGSIGAGASPGTKFDAYNSGTTSTVIRARNDTTTVFLDANNAYAYLNVFTNHPLLFGTNNAERARFTAAGGFTCLGIYNTIVGATNRDVFVDNAGVVGYVSSTRESKTNIENLQNTDWLYALNPVTFNYRKRDDNGEYTDEIDGDIQYGMIAEDVEQIRPDLCFYDEIDGEQHLRGIQYSKLVPVMLKAMQQLKTQLDEAKAEIDTLKGNA